MISHKCRLKMNNEKHKRTREIEERVISGFGDEWTRFPQDQLSETERDQAFQDYFSVFPWEKLSKTSSVGADIGCGSGRWAVLAAPRVKLLHVVDPSQEALEVAKANLVSCSNVEFNRATVDRLLFPEASLDFAYCLGVLHAVPDTVGAVKAISRVLGPGARFLLYLYYKLDEPRYTPQECKELRLTFGMPFRIGVRLVRGQVTTPK